MRTPRSCSCYQALVLGDVIGRRCAHNSNKANQYTSPTNLQINQHHESQTPSLGYNRNHSRRVWYVCSVSTNWYLFSTATILILTEYLMNQFCNCMNPGEHLRGSSLPIKVATSTHDVEGVSNDVEDYSREYSQSDVASRELRRRGRNDRNRGGTDRAVYYKMKANEKRHRQRVDRRNGWGSNGWSSGGYKEGLHCSKRHPCHHNYYGPCVGKNC